jgi:gamma-glutamyltranspeptidase/glutathione hydrolase
VDAQGNAVAVTVTLNSSYGSGVYVREAGFFLNNEMDDFATVVGRPNQFGLIEGENNTIVPGKRMLSSMTPTIVLDSTGGMGLVLGAAGGPAIITAVAQVILNVRRLPHAARPGRCCRADSSAGMARLGRL